MPTINVLDAAGTTQALEKPNTNGRATAANSRPVTLANEDLAAINAVTTAINSAAFYPATQPVSGTVTVSGVATAANQATANGLLADIEAAIGGTLNVTGPLTDTQLRASAVPVSGTFWPTTQPVSIASTVAVSGPLTDAQLRASAVPVSAASLPLPTGAATAELQTTGNTALAAIRSAVEGVQTVAVAGAEYETVSASQTDQALGATGATGDRIDGLTVIPATTSPGAVSIKDGSNTAITVFTGGASSVGSLVPFFVPLGLTSTSGAWQITTGANVSVIASGNFT